MGMNFWMRDTLWVNRFTLPRNGTVMTVPSFFDQMAGVWSWGCLSARLLALFFDKPLFGSLCLSGRGGEVTAFGAGLEYWFSWSNTTCSIGSGNSH